jgi:hypothetical protein
MVASRDIEEGEEITYDYATSEVEGSYHLPMKCLCGSSICRGTIKPTDYLEPWFKERYGTKNCTSVIRARLEALEKQNEK